MNLPIPPCGIINMISYNILINTSSLHQPNSEVDSFLEQQWHNHLSPENYGHKFS